MNFLCRTLVPLRRRRKSQRDFIIQLGVARYEPPREMCRAEMSTPKGLNQCMCRPMQLFQSCAAVG